MSAIQWNVEVFDLSLQRMYPYRSNSSRESCMKAIRQATCYLCCSTNTYQYIDAQTGVLSLCESSCSYINSQCGSAFGTTSSNEQDFCNFVVLHWLYNFCPRDETKAVAVTSINIPQYSTQCLDLAVGDQGLALRVLGYIGGFAGIIAGFYYICFATRFPILSLFLQTFVAVAGIFALSTIAAQLSTGHLDATVIVPLIFSLLPAVTTAYLVIKLRRLGFFVTGATIGMAFSGIFLSFVYPAILKGIPQTSQYAGIVTGGILIVIGGFIGVFLGEVLLRINFLVLGCSVLAVSVSTYFAGAQMNLPALLIDHTHFGCATVACWLSVSGWICLIGLVIVLTFCCTFTMPTRASFLPKV